MYKNETMHKPAHPSGYDVSICLLGFHSILSYIREAFIESH